MSLTNTIIAALKRIALVPVYVGERQNVGEDSILISSIKLGELTQMYSDLYQFSHKAWRNLPTPPECESTFVFMWMIASDSYDVNHFTIRWQDATPNTFVHLWSIIDRLRTMLEPANTAWLLNSRDPVGYSTSMNMTGAADTYLYPKESIVPPHVEIFSSNMSRMKCTQLNKDYASSYDFMQSLRLPKTTFQIDIDKMSMRNNEIAHSKRNKP